MSGAESVIFEGEGGSLRLDGGVVRVVQGRTTVIASLRAVHHVDVEEGGGRVHVHLHISDEGDTTTYTVRNRNSTAAHAFRRVVTAAVERARRDPEARADVRRVEAPGWSPGKRRWVTAAALYVCLLIWAFSLLDGEADGLLFVFHLGLVFLRLAWFLLRPLVVLRRRGITVRADVVRYHHLSQTVRPRYRYTTVEGSTITADSAVQLFSTHASDRVDVAYDPDRPDFVAPRSDLRTRRHLPELLLAALGLWWSLTSAVELAVVAVEALL